MPRCFTCVQKKTKPTPISAQLSPIMQPARNIKWRSSSKQCNSFLFPLFLPLFPVPRLRRRRRFETLIAHIQIPGRCATHTQRHIEGGLLLTIKIPLSLSFVAIAGSSVRRMSNAKRRRRVRQSECRFSQRKLIVARTLPAASYNNSWDEAHTLARLCIREIE